MIKVKLTDYGKMIYRESFVKYGLAEPKIKVDTEGYTEFQLHEFINTFGGYFGSELPCSPNVKIQAKEECHFQIDEKEIEAIADKIRHDKTARKDFCKRVGISEDEFFIKQNGDFEIEDMVRAYRMGIEKTNNANQSGDFRERYEKQKQINLELAEENEDLKKHSTAQLWIRWFM